ncbi:hypothetical protein [Eubacterium barkeri]|uniref:Uncharacterized protein n=1 Tax=Eubacterium barkeri TaxID=1528 RepID=A0A1H3HY28_EUBBA|nr:hypothetical protein [Eubacterium barkeri]SDY20337.1 hypothetical protein SAMN04488579_1203 [Eubacterium barkeri]
MLNEKKKFIIVAVALLLIMLACGVWFALQNRSIDIDPNAGNYESSLKRPENIGQSKILIPGYGEWTMKKGSDTIESVLFNPEGNPCFFKFEIIERDNGDVLYQSRLVPPGQGISPIKLSKTFNEVGTYNVVLKFQSVDLEDQKTNYNGSDVEVKLNVVE